MDTITSTQCIPDNIDELLIPSVRTRIPVALFISVVMGVLIGLPLQWGSKGAWRSSLTYGIPISCFTFLSMFAGSNYLIRLAWKLRLRKLGWRDLCDRRGITSLMLGLILALIVAFSAQVALLYFIGTDTYTNPCDKEFINSISQPNSH